METTTNLAGPNVELQKTDQFFIEHHDLLEKLIKERDAFLARLNRKVLDLRDMMSEAGAIPSLNKPPWVYQGNCLVLDFKFANACKIAFDLYLKPVAWELQLFSRNPGSTPYLHKLVNQPALQAQEIGNKPVENSRFIVGKWPIQTDLSAMKDALSGWVGALIEASKTVSD